jgi:hypothetical protein
MHCNIIVTEYLYGVLHGITLLATCRYMPILILHPISSPILSYILYTMVKCNATCVACYYMML